jgi:hypothetical protein
MTNYGFLDKELADRLYLAVQDIEAKFAGDPKGKKSEFESLMDQYNGELGYRTVFLLKQATKEGQAWDRLTKGMSIKEGVPLDRKQVDQIIKNYMNMIEGDASIHTDMMAFRAKYENFMNQRLSSDDVADIAFSGEYDDHVSLLREGIEEEKVASLLPDSDDKPTIMSKIKKYAKITKELNDMMYMDLKAAGANVKYFDGYLFRQSTDVNKLHELGRDGYVEYLLGDITEDGNTGALDISRSFFNSMTKDKTPDQIKKDLSEILVEHYIHMTSKDVGWNGSEVGNDFPDVLKRLKTRRIVLKPGEAMKYQKALGYDGNLRDSIMSTSRANGKIAAITRHVGDQKMFDLQLEKRLKTKANPSDTSYISNQLKNKLDPVKKNFNAPYGEIDNNLSNSQKFWRKAYEAVTATQLFKLGATVFMGFFDPAQNVLQSFKYTGGAGFALGEGIKHAAQTTQEFAKGAPPAFMDLMGFKNTQQMIDYMANDFNISLAVGQSVFRHADDVDPSGALGTIINKASALTLLPLQTMASMKASSYRSANMFRHILKKQGPPNKFTQAFYNDFGFNAKDVQALKIMEGNLDAQAYITSSDILSIDLADIADVYGIKTLEVAARKRLELSHKYGNYIQTTVSSRTPLSGLKQKRQLGKGGDVADDYRKFFMKTTTQFIDTPLKMLQDNISAYKTVKEAGGMSKVIAGAGAYGIAAMVSYIIQDNLKSAILNKPSSLQKVMEGDKDAIPLAIQDFVARAGFIPLAGDSLINMTSPDRFANPLVVTPFGPAGSVVQDFQKYPVKGAYRDGAVGAMKGLGVWAGKHFLPTSNFLLRGASRHLLEFDTMTMKKVRRKDMNAIRK